jgi:hypothetical protein
MAEKKRKVIVGRRCTAESAGTPGNVVDAGWEGELDEGDARTLVGIGKAYFLDGDEGKDPRYQDDIKAIRKSFGKSAKAEPEPDAEPAGAGGGSRKK